MEVGGINASTGAGVFRGPEPGTGVSMNSDISVSADEVAAGGGAESADEHAIAAANIGSSSRIR